MIARYLMTEHVDSSILVGLDLGLIDLAEHFLTVLSILPKIP